MKVLAISAGRRMGNSEVLLRHAMRGAADEGCQVQLIRLQDFEIKPCLGCEVCITKKVLDGGDSVCAISESADGYSTYVRLALEADGYLLAAPCYNLTAAGRMLDMLNRQHRFLSQLKRKCREKARYAATIGVGGSDWTNFLMPVLNFAATELCGSQMHLADQLLAEFHPAPGTVVLEEGLTDRACRLGRNLARAMRADKGRDCYLGDAEEVCPICHGSHLQLRRGRLICPTCDIEARVTEEDGALRITWEQGYDLCRWSEYGDKRHLDAIRRGHGRLREHRQQVQAALEPLRDAFTPVQPQRAPINLSTI